MCEHCSCIMSHSIKYSIPRVSPILDIAGQSHLPWRTSHHDAVTLTTPSCHAPTVHIGFKI